MKGINVLSRMIIASTACLGAATIAGYNAIRVVEPTKIAYKQWEIIHSLSPKEREKAMELLANKDTWISEMEGKLDISFAIKPRVEYACCMMVDSENGSKQTFGDYSPENWTITIYPNDQVLASNSAFQNPAVKEVLGLKNTLSIREVFMHEAGHHYVAQVKRENGLLIDLRTCYYEDDPVCLAKMVLEEGIAEYISRKMSGRSMKSTLPWPKSIFELQHDHDNAPRRMYELGTDLVSSVLERNTAKGVHELTRDPLTPADFKDLTAYSQRIIKKMRD